jgi:hypothetical protein
MAMADEPQTDASVTVRQIDWRSTFPFTLIFRSFRVAIHPSKLVLALLALLLIYLGGSLLDTIWPEAYRATLSEVRFYEETRDEANPRAAFNERRNGERTSQGRLLQEVLPESKRPNGDYDDARYAIRVQRDDRVKLAWSDFDRDKNAPNAAKIRDDAITAAYRDADRLHRQALASRGLGLFDTFSSYELGQVNQIMGAVRSFYWIGPGSVTDGFVKLILVGPLWLAQHHYVFFTIFFLWFLSVWSIFGGAIARIAAVHVARDEKISIRQALAFSVSKFLSFLSAPLIPLVIVGVVGVVVAAGGFLGNIPVIGPIVVGGLFFLALAAGFVMTLVLLGTIGGANLMYPTIAVEGSDSFDAISRSFSYLYARPWRLGFYTLVSLIYGGLCYLFVRFFIYVMLWVTHFFAGLWFVYRADDTRPLFTAMWPDPYASIHLRYAVDYFSLGGAQSIGAFLLWMWVSLTIAMLGAFAISFYFSVNTVIYYLMRQEVDATELDDVYLEHGEEEFTTDTLAGQQSPPAVTPAESTSTPLTPVQTATTTEPPAPAEAPSAGQDNPPPP